MWNILKTQESFKIPVLQLNRLIIFYATNKKFFRSNACFMRTGINLKQN